MDDGASSTGHAFGVRERVGFLEVDGVSVSWNDDFRGQCSPRVAEHYIARVAAAAVAVVMLGLALHLARAVLHETCCAAQARSWAIYMLALALGSNAFEALLVPAAFAP